MNEIKITIEATGLVNALNNIANAISAKGMVNADTMANVNAQPTNNVPVVTPTIPQTPITPTAPVVANTASVPTAPIVTPQVPTVPTTNTIPQMYTQAQMALAATKFVDSGRMELLMQILGMFGASTIMEVPKEQYGNLAAKFRENGVEIQ